MGVLTAVFNTLIVLTSLFLICLILIQRGKGGGLAGAFGGVGGSSAFGTKAGDTFTKITVVTAAVWILMAMLLVVMTSRRSGLDWGSGAAASASKTAGKGKTRHGNRQGPGVRLLPARRGPRLIGHRPGHSPGLELPGHARLGTEETLTEPSHRRAQAGARPELPVPEGKAPAGPIAAGRFGRCGRPQPDLLASFVVVLPVT